MFFLIKLVILRLSLELLHILMDSLFPPKTEINQYLNGFHIIQNGWICDARLIRKRNEVCVH